MRLTAVIEREDDVAGQGDSIAEARNNFTEASYFLKMNLLEK